MSQISDTGTLSDRPRRRAFFQPIHKLLGLSPDEASFRRRGFNGANPASRLALETAGKTFIGGYNTALEADRAEDVLQHVNRVPRDLRGFAVEGAAMGAAIADVLPFRRWTFAQHLQTFERDYSYLNHVGAGWAIARLRWRERRIVAQLDTVHHWLAYDGWGFHDGFFHHRFIIAGWRRQLFGYAARAYDQGIGRALWFVSGGSVADATGLIGRFSKLRRDDLWSGLGLAMAYAGPFDEAGMSAACSNAGRHRIHFVQGVAFACEAHVRAQCIPEHTDQAARLLTGLDAAQVSALVRAARAELLPDQSHPPAYEIWRQKVASATSASPE